MTAPRKFSGDDLVVATHNKGKLQEIRQMFGSKIKNLYAVTDFNLESPEETGTTFIENAKLKALFVAKASGKIALADDSGICIHALDGAPGVYSADWAETGNGTRDFGKAMQKVYDDMGENPDKGAQFVSVLALAWPDCHCETVEGIAPGRIIWPPRGKSGHGYDPIFVPEGYDITYGEMPAEQKNSISHRSIAFKKMLEKWF